MKRITGGLGYLSNNTIMVPASKTFLPHNAFRQQLRGFQQTKSAHLLTHQSSILWAFQQTQILLYQISQTQFHNKEKSIFHL
ncbi:hypothetical protein CDL12_13144 [Handroanthus impetiginosus]|uniref:Uncharacterized protein n=1 Tax=Handroanthus impetiginosus TaxID=429701 RepID=A0A2G9H9Q1_9LAMI|nr:hypothetical protein CDL12_13144 [Handroanthus impetiginosus]